MNSKTAGVESLCIEQIIKRQFVRVFVPTDWALFKKMAEFYLRGAGALRLADINAESEIELLARNSQKRLHIGVGIELLLKAVYLKRGYQINKLRDKQANPPSFPYTFQQVERFALRDDKTYMLGDLICALPKLVKFDANVDRGLRIAMVFRTKEGHTVLPRHQYVPDNYRDIERSISTLFASEFKEKLDVRFSVGVNEEHTWKVSPLPT